MKKTLLSTLGIGMIVFACAVSFQMVLTNTIFSTTVFFKYEVLSQHFIEQSLDRERLLDVSPLYFRLHVAARRLFPHSPDLLRGLQSLIGGVSAVFLFGILRKFFPVSLSLLGTFAFITSRSVMLYTSILEPEPFMICFVLGFLLFALHDHWLSLCLSGVCLSLSLLTRSNFLPMTLITPLYLFLRSSDKRHAFRVILLFEIPVLLSMTVLTIRNSELTGTFNIFSMNPGYVFFEGNNPNSQGESAIYPPLIDHLMDDFDADQPDYQHELYRLVARRIQGEALTIPEVNTYWAQKARNFMIDHPFHTLKRILIKLHFFFHNYRRHDLAIAYRNDQHLQHTRIPTIPYALIAGLALIGIMRIVKHWQRYLLFYGVLGVQLGIMLLTYVSDRQRVVLIAPMILFALYGLPFFFQRAKRSILFLVLLLNLFLLFYLPTDLIQDDLHTWARYAASSREITLARQARTAGELKEASRHNALALALAPGLAESRRLALLSFQPATIQEQALELALRFENTRFPDRFDLAQLLLITQRLDEAENLLHALIAGKYTLARQHYQSSQLHFYLARIAEVQDEIPEAIALLQQALAQNPGDPWVLSHLAALTDQPAYEQALFRYFDALDAEMFLGKACFETGRFQEAVAHFSAVVQKIPEYRRGRIYLSLSLAKAGDIEQAVQYYLSAIHTQRDPIFAEQGVIQMFRDRAAMAAQQPEATYYLGVILQEFGHYAEALALQKTIVQQEEFLEAAHLTSLRSRINWLEKALAE